MKELPYFRFTCQEWDSGDISLESDTVKGLFITVCSYYWSQNCTVLHAKLTRKFPRKTATVTKLLNQGIIKLDGDYIRISFLDKQLAELDKKHNILSEAGKKGAEAREQKKQATHKPPISIKIDKDKIDKDKDKKKEGSPVTRFSKPSLEELQSFITEKGYTFQAESFYGYYESNGWKVGKNPMKNWKACCITWQGREKTSNTRPAFKTAMEKQDDELGKIMASYTINQRGLNELPGPE